MVEHLKVKPAMINDLKVIGYNFSNDQQIFASIRSIPESGEALKLTLMQKENIKCLVTSQASWVRGTKLLTNRSTVLVDHVGQHKLEREARETGELKWTSKRRHHAFRRNKKLSATKDKSKLKCYNCRKKVTSFRNVPCRRKYTLTLILRPSHKHRKLGPRVSKFVFIRPDCSKVMWRLLNTLME